MADYIHGSHPDAADRLREHAAEVELLLDSGYIHEAPPGEDSQTFVTGEDKGHISIAEMYLSPPSTEPGPVQRPISGTEAITLGRELVHEIVHHENPWGNHGHNYQAEYRFIQDVQIYHDMLTEELGPAEIGSRRHAEEVRLAELAMEAERRFDREVQRLRALCAPPVGLPF